MDFSLARQRFYQELQRDNIDLARAALCIAQQEYPELDPEPYLAQLDTWAAAIADRLPDERYPLRVVKAISAYLCHDLGFSGNTEQYYDPRNSYLNDVLERRTGIPISLSLVYLELAKRLDFPMVGIGMPGHFLIRPDFEDAGIFVDVFNGGEILFPEDCQARLSEIYGQPIELRPEFLAPIAPRRFLMRSLMNLKGIYLSKRDIPRTLRTIENILMVWPEAIEERRDRGLLYFQQGRYIEARHDLEFYLQSRPDARDQRQIQMLLDNAIANENQTMDTDADLG
ncbi:MAG: tetratricopeptide repeat protein [Coleofasciculaceae cyanobacterium RL_1_1]|nr:tetratricopeptide repeat protein [Coleofasciculaceae cyanobacterium RL_1_1]